MQSGDGDNARASGQNQPRWDDSTVESLKCKPYQKESVNEFIKQKTRAEVDVAAREYYENREGKNGSTQEVSSVSTEGQDSSNQEKTGAATQEESLLADYSQGDLDSKQAQKDNTFESNHLS
jgi:hypothetical protein